MTAKTVNNEPHRYQFNSVPSVELGLGAAVDLAENVVKLGAERTMVITDASLLKLGLLEPALSRFSDSGIEVFVFSEVHADPPDTDVLQAVDFARAKGCDSVIGFGGGSPMDVAKLVAVLAHSSNDSLLLNQMYGVEQFDAPRLPLIQLPTTAGTGSEATAVAIITTGETTKAGVVSSNLLADKIILDPVLTLGLPPAITAATGIDAMVHAIEAYTSKRLKNPVSDALALQALRLMSNSIERAVFDGSDIDARSDMLLGAMLAGQAFANAPVGGVHALAYPLGGLFHVAHGLSNSLVLPHVLRFNESAANELYSQLASNIFNKSITGGGAKLLAEYFSEMASKFSLPTKLVEVGVVESDLELLAEQAMLQQRLLINNPRSITQRDALAIYQQAF